MELDQKDAATTPYGCATFAESVLTSRQPAAICSVDFTEPMMSRISIESEVAQLPPEMQNLIKLFVVDIEKRFWVGSYGRLQIKRGINEALAIATALHLAGEESNANVKESLGWHSQQGNGPARSKAHELAERSDLTAAERETLAKDYPALYRQWVRQNVAVEQDN